MLHLVRRPHEAIIIDLDGRKVRLKTWRTTKGQLKFAISAPRDIPILRQEVIQRAEKDDKAN